MTIAESQEINTKMARLEQVNRWLNLVDELPLGHPDRLRFLAYADRSSRVLSPRKRPWTAKGQIDRGLRAGAPAPPGRRKLHARRG